MGIKPLTAAVSASAVALVALPVEAATVRASEPQTLVDAFRAAGHGATLVRDETGDPQINLELAGLKAILLFYECEAATRCQSVQFRASFDAEGEGMSAAEALRFVGQQRHAAVTLNSSGDPTLRWDVEVGKGIPDTVLITATERFFGAVRAMAAILFPQPAGS